MSEQTPSERVLAPLREEPAQATLSADARARILASMRKQVREVPRARARVRMQRWVGAGMALAACLTAAWLSRDVAQRAPLAAVSIDGVGATWTDDARTEHTLHGPERFASEGQLAVPMGAQAELVTTAGVRVHVEANTRLALRQRAERLLLERGSVRCQVPKLGATRTFEVEARGTRVIVHGTAFSVALDAASTACVRVTEGRVEVRASDGASTMLMPGESWGCSAPVAPAVRAPAVERTEVFPSAKEPAYAPVRRHHRRRAMSTLPDSTLREENALLAAALRAEREHELARAHVLFGELLRRYPRSPLVPEAEAGARRTAHE